VCLPRRARDQHVPLRFLLRAPPAKHPRATTQGTENHSISSIGAPHSETVGGFNRGKIAKIRENESFSYTGGDALSETVEDCVLEVAEQGEVDHEQEDEGHRQCDGPYHGPDVKRVDLAPNDPLERPLRHVDI
jgi:hypothetical protein